MILKVTIAVNKINTAVCANKMVMSGPAKSASNQSCSDSKAIDKYRDKDALPNTSIARSKISTFSTCSKTLRTITPVPKAHTKVGNSNHLPWLKIGRASCRERAYDHAVAG